MHTKAKKHVAVNNKKVPCIQYFENCERLPVVHHVDTAFKKIHKCKIWIMIMAKTAPVNFNEVCFELELVKKFYSTFVPVGTMVMGLYLRFG